jgi:hypothetical protein
MHANPDLFSDCRKIKQAVIKQQFIENFMIRARFFLKRVMKGSVINWNLRASKRQLKELERPESIAPRW